MQPLNGNCITEEVTEMPRCCSSRIQSEVAWRAAFRPLTVPASWMAPPNSSSFSVSVVLPASGWEMMAKVRLLPNSPVITSTMQGHQQAEITHSWDTNRSPVAPGAADARWRARAYSRKLRPANAVGYGRQTVSASPPLPPDEDGGDTRA